MRYERRVRMCVIADRATAHVDVRCMHMYVAYQCVCAFKYTYGCHKYIATTQTKLHVSVHSSDKCLHTLADGHHQQQLQCPLAYAHQV
jgi:hypothetical protein